MTTKSTHEPYKTDLFAPIIKQTKGKYLAVLSDDSVDRDEERIGKSALEKIAKKKGYLAALIDHENKVLNQVARWEHIQLKQIGKNTALVAEPVFFESNPNAKIIKGMLDEGAEIGISIGAIVKEYEDQTYENKSYRTFTDLELIEASFVAVPSNRHGRAMAVAKSFKMEEKTMSELTQKDIEIAVKEKETELTKTITEKDLEITKLSDSVKELEKSKEEMTTEKDALVKSIEDLKMEVEKTKKQALEKQHFNEEGNDNTPVDAEKCFKDGMIPIARL